MRRAKQALDARALTLIEAVALALARYEGVEPAELHRRMALKLLRGVIRRAPRRQPDVGTLVG